jgi:hypothetical protein
MMTGLNSAHSVSASTSKQEGLTSKLYAEFRKDVETNDAGKATLATQKILSQLGANDFETIVSKVAAESRNPNFHVIYDEEFKIVALHLGKDHIYAARPEKKPAKENSSLPRYTFDMSRDKNGVIKQKQNFPDPMKNFEVDTSTVNGVVTRKFTYADPSIKNLTVETSNDNGKTTESYKFKDPADNYTVQSFTDDKGVHQKKVFADGSTSESTQDLKAKTITIVNKPFGQPQSTIIQTYDAQFNIINTTQL